MEDDAEYIRYLEGQHLVAQFPCSMTRSYFLFTVLMSTLFMFLIVLIIGVVFSIILSVSLGDISIGIFISFLILGFGVIILLLTLITGFSSYKKTISGNKVKLTDQGIQVYIKPFHNCPVIRNFFSYHSLVSVTKPDRKELPSGSLYALLSPNHFTVLGDYSEGQLYISETKGTGILKLTMDRPVTVRFLKIGDYITKGIPGIMLRRVHQLDANRYETQRIFIDIEEKYHAKFIELVNKLKLKAKQLEETSSGGVANPVPDKGEIPYDPSI